MPEISANQIINGSSGRLWVGGERYANVKSFEAKVTMEYEDVILNGELGTARKYLGYSIEGTIVLHKVDSRIAKLTAKGITSGNMPEFNVVAKVDDPQAVGAERVELSGVTFDELMLVKFENKAVGEESVPFKAFGFKYIDMI